MPYTPLDNTEEWPAYSQQRGRFEGAAEALRKSKPEPPQKHPFTEPRQWQMGDLITNKYTGVNALILMDYGKSLDLIDSTGSAHAIGKAAANTEWDYHCNTGLSYGCDYDREKVLSDFSAGLFDPYFKML